MLPNFIVWFTCMLKWTGSDWNSTPLDEPTLIDIYKVCDLYLIEDGVRFAQEHLANITMSPVHRLELAQRLRIPQWISSPLKHLIDQPLASMSLNDIEHIGLHAFAVIAKARETIKHEVQLLAASPPLLPASSTCRTHNECKTVWIEGWYKKIHFELLHPKKPLPLEDLVDVIYITDYPNLTMSCKEGGVRSLLDSDSLRAPEKIKDIAVETLLRIYGFTTNETI